MLYFYDIMGKRSRRNNLINKFGFRVEKLENKGFAANLMNLSAEKLMCNMRTNTHAYLVFYLLIASYI